MMPRRASTVLLLFVVAACRDGAPTSPEAGPAPSLSVAVVRGDSQFGPPDRLLPDFLVLRVIDRDGRPIAGLPVAWGVVSGGGKVSGKRHDTDVDGLAAGNFTLGPRPGEHVARAWVSDSLTVEFTAFAVATGPDEPLP
jgi:hypothetical protein